MTEPKFCKDCKHFMPAGAELVFGLGMGWPSMCVHPKNTSEPELVNGRRHQLAKPADLREPDAICGPDGVMFEARPEPSQIGSWQIVRSDPPKRGFWDFLGF